MQNNEKLINSENNVLTPVKVKLEPTNQRIKTEPVFNTGVNQIPRDSNIHDDSDDDDIIFVGYGDTNPINLVNDENENENENEKNKDEEIQDKIEEKTRKESCSSEDTYVFEDSSSRFDADASVSHELEPGEVLDTTDDGHLHSNIDIGEETKYSNVDFPEVLLDVTESSKRDIESDDI